MCNEAIAKKIDALFLRFGTAEQGQGSPLPPGFSQVFILNVDKVLCFDTLLQVLILKGLIRRLDLR